MTEDVENIIGISVVLLPIVAYLAYTLYFRIQARMHEFMLTLVVSTMPLGFLLSMFQESPERTSKLELAKILVIGMFPTMLLFGGSIWALSAAQRIKVERTWTRLGMMLVGWLVIPAAVYAIIAIGVVISAEKLDWPVVVILGIAPIPLYLAYRIERACPKRDDSRTH